MLNLENISFAVQDGKKTKEIIHNVNLSLPSGKLTVITGPNGGGKSTLARLIAGIEKPSEGRILLNDADITGKTITERAKAGIGFAFQQPVRFKGIRVIDLLRLATGKQLTTQEACEYLSAVGLCALDYVRREVNASLRRFPSSTNPKRASTCGASRISSSSSRTCAKTSTAAPFSSSPIRSAS